VQVSNIGHATAICRPQSAPHIADPRSRGQGTGHTRQARRYRPGGTARGR